MPEDHNSGFYRVLYCDAWFHGKRVNALTNAAELVFTRLILLADLNGVGPADPDDVYYRACARKRGLSREAVSDAIDEAAAIGLIRRWKSGKHTFFVMIDAPQQLALRNGRRPRQFPAPPAADDDRQWIDPPGLADDFRYPESTPEFEDQEGGRDN